MIQNATAPVNTPSEDIFRVFTPENEPVPNQPVVQQQPDQPVNNLPEENQPIWRGLTDEEFYEEDMQEFLRVEYEEAQEARAREQRAKAKQDRRNRRAQWRWEMGKDRVPTSEDDSISSYSSHEGYVSDDSFY